MKLDHKPLAAHVYKNIARSKLGMLVAALLACAHAGSVSIHAATVNWIGPSPNSYTNKPSWSTGNLPASTDTAVVGNATALSGSVQYTNAAAIKKLCRK
jgi:hypothetical protein